MNVRVEILVLPDFIYQLFNDARVQDQIMQQEIITCVELWWEYYDIWADIFKQDGFEFKNCQREIQNVNFSQWCYCYIYLVNEIKSKYI